MRRLTWLDLFSGLGGASQPAKDRGWRVIRVDIEERFKPDIVADVRTLPLTKFPVDFLWASPPCQEFSKHGMMNRFYPDAPPPNLGLVHAVLDALNWFQPQWWAIENVSGARRFFSPFLGDPVKIGSHLIWGKLPGLLPCAGVTRKGGDYGNWMTRVENVIAQCGEIPVGWPRNYKTLAALSAKIPYEVGTAICAAVEKRMAL